jgi:hypothetical protein
MLAAHDKHGPSVRQMRNRLKATGVGLGLVRLLLDAGRTKEARTTLTWLQEGFRGIAAGARTNASPGHCITN